MMIFGAPRGILEAPQGKLPSCLTFYDCAADGGARMGPDPVRCNRLTQTPIRAALQYGCFSTLALSLCSRL